MRAMKRQSLLDLMVHPEFQRRGIGRQLVPRAIEDMN